MANTSSDELDDRGAGVELVDVVKRYSGRRVLDGVSLRIEAGRVHALVGANGAGKSTLGKCIAGVTRPDEGTIRFEGRAVRWREASDARRAGIALIAQELAVAPELTVRENVFMGIEPRRGVAVARRQMRRRYDELVERWGLAIDGDAVAGRLRLAEQQKVEILRAVASGARVIVMDEPTSSLTHVETEILHTMIAELCREGRTIIYVSHFLDAVLEVADAVSVLRNGRLVATSPAAGLTEQDLVTHMFGESAGPALERRRRTDARPVALEVVSLSRKGVLRDVSLTVGAGEVVGLAGLVGSGRSELVRAIFGVDRRDAGTIAVAGEQRRIRSPREAIAAGIALVPESRKDDGLFLELSLARNVTFASLRHVAATAGFVRRGAERRATRKMMDALAIVAKGPEAKVSSLSGGNQQKVLFAKWMLRQPAVLLLDEPTRGVDVSARAAIHALIDDLAAQGVGILLISSEFEEVCALADRILVVREGAIVAELPGQAPVSEVTEAAFGLGAALGRAG